MPSHIYMRLGDYRAAVASNLKAVAADRAYGQKSGREAPLAGHTREFLAVAATMTGQSKLVREAEDNLFVLLRFQRWDDILQRPMPEAPIGTLEWRVARVLALVGRGRLREAEAARTEYEVTERSLPKEATWWADPIEKFLPMVRKEMDARLAWARGDRTLAINHLGKLEESFENVSTSILCHVAGGSVLYILCLRPAKARVRHGQNADGVLEAVA
jgi:hypothetical protein